jgi:hypothetical protein
MAAGASVLIFQPPAPISKDLLIIKEPFSLSMSGAPPAGGKVSRRDFLKLMAAAGTVMTFAPFVDWGKFLPNSAANVGERVKAQLVNGDIVNVKTFDVNTSNVIIYPRSEDEAQRSEIVVAIAGGTHHPLHRRSPAGEIVCVLLATRVVDERRIISAYSGAVSLESTAAIIRAPHSRIQIACRDHVPYSGNAQLLD